MNSANLAAYRNAVRQSISDGAIDTAKTAMLEKLRKALGITDSDHDAIVAELVGSVGVAANLPAGGDNGGSTPTQPQQFVEASSANGPPTGPGGSPGDVVVPDAGAADITGSDPKALLKKGKESYRAGNYDEAIALCQKALDIDPKNSEAQFFMKRARLKAGKKPGAAAEKVKDPLFSHSVSAPEPKPEAKPEPAPEVPATTKDDVAKPEPAADSENKSGLDFENAPDPDPNCTSCGGTGVCSWCQGKKQCWMCNGSGQCNECKGKGMVGGKPCPTCKGSGTCTSCNGTGQCHWCKGSGLCHRCIVAKMLWG